jgi:1-aminocyclopropane-1-carboxylate deaminase/D-cysteine desulfhydrase-like pyridoxal-dependent ACC family enzyme
VSGPAGGATRLPPRWPLAVLPTPLVPALRLGDRLGLDIWVKRDDLTGFGVAGNKARALEILVADAVESGCDHIVGCGGAASNFCAGLAMAAATAGLSCTLVLYGRPVSAPPHPNLAIAVAAGASITHTGDPDRGTVEPAAAEVAAGLVAAGARPYLVPRGGATPLGAVGFALAATELMDQLEPVRRLARIVLAAGSGASAAGLVAGLAGIDGAAGLSVIAAAVSRPAGETRQQITRLAAACAELIGGPDPAGVPLEVVDCIGPGFGVADPEAAPMVELARRREGLLFDPTYTAKAAALLPMLSERSDETTILWHTGGSVGALAHVADTVDRRGPVHAV